MKLGSSEIMDRVVFNIRCNDAPRVSGEYVWDAYPIINDKIAMKVRFVVDEVVYYGAGNLLRNQVFNNPTIDFTFVRPNTLILDLKRFI